MVLRRAGGVRYALRSLIVHEGHRAGAGHYVAYVRPSENRWYLCDDTMQPREILNTQHVLDQQAYMLMYERVSLDTTGSSASASSNAAGAGNGSARSARGVA